MVEKLYIYCYERNLLNSYNTYPAYSAHLYNKYCHLHIEFFLNALYQE